jgi:hypothetical protein
MSLSHIESPSALLAFALVSGTRIGERITVGQVQDPDPREPRRPVDILLWRYDGLLPRPAVQPPGRGAARTAAALAAGRYFPPRCRLDAAAILLRRLGRKPVPDLLGLMVHPPAPPATIPAWTWIRRIQALSALAIAQLDDGWHRSPHRTILLDLAEGPEDWVIEAALAALAMIADSSEEARPEIVDVFTRQLVWHADHAGGHHVQSRHATAQLALSLPRDALPDGFTELAEAIRQHR